LIPAPAPAFRQTRHRPGPLPPARCRARRPRARRPRGRRPPPRVPPLRPAPQPRPARPSAPPTQTRPKANDPGTPALPHATRVSHRDSGPVPPRPRALPLPPARSCRVSCRSAATTPVRPAVTPFGPLLPVRPAVTRSARCYPFGVRAVAFVFVRRTARAILISGPSYPSSSGTCRSKNSMRGPLYPIDAVEGSSH
jgi:hypothetical protein